HRRRPTCSVPKRQQSRVRVIDRVKQLGWEIRRVLREAKMMRKSRPGEGDLDRQLLVSGDRGGLSFVVRSKETASANRWSPHLLSNIIVVRHFCFLMSPRLLLTSFLHVNWCYQ
ncbi:unnamed protein product, partial [Musa banksii]